MAYKLPFIHYFAIPTTPWDRHYYLYLASKEAKVREVENHVQVAQLLDAGVWILAWLWAQQGAQWRQLRFASVCTQSHTQEQEEGHRKAQIHILPS